MPTTCCVVNCGSRGDRDRVNFYKICSELRFAHRVDLNELSKRRRQKWIHAIRRKDLTEVKLKYSRVCSKHFVSGKPSKLNDENNPDWVPSLAMGYGNNKVVHNKSHVNSVRDERARKRRTHKIEDISEKVPDEIEDVELLEAQTKENDKSCQTNITAEDFTGMIISLEATKKLQARIQKVEMCYNFLKDNDIKTKYYTGLNSFNKLQVLVEALKDYIPVHHNSSLSVFEQVLLTMIKLRLNLDFKDLAYRFGISPTTASTYFKNIIDVLYNRLKKLIVWPSRDILKETMPTCFTDSFGDKISVIIDCFEIYIEKPSNLLRSAQCWSHYKHHHTVKFLIGITPQGTINFISEAWCGRASDKHIVINSKFLDNIIPGDVILADRGFLIQDYLKLFRAELQIPAFTKGKKQLHPIELEATRAIAHVRIHVERVIGCIHQKYRILSDNMPISLLVCGEDDPILDKIVTVCCGLINICPPIVPLS